jgi:hypothetical protein
VTPHSRSQPYLTHHWRYLRLSVRGWYMLSSMRAGIKIAFVLMTALVVLLWVAANTRAIPIIRGAITVIPPPAAPKPFKPHQC